MQRDHAATPLLASRLSGAWSIWAGDTAPLGATVVIGRVHSVFRSVVNVASECGLVTVADEAVGGLPDGALVDLRRRGLDLRSAGIRPGTIVSRIGSQCRVDGTAVTIELAGAPEWSARLPRLHAAAWPGRSALARALAARHSAPGGLRAIPSARRHLASLDDAIAAQERETASAAAIGLIGLGPGLTPSGDDALTGVEAALHAIGDPLAGFLGDALGDVDARTTSISAAMLRHATDGDVAERVHRLLEALLGPSGEDLAPAIERTVAWGATSGSDLLQGVLLGLDSVTSARRVAA